MAWGLELGAWSLGHRAWSSEHGARSMGLGAWGLEQGLVVFRAGKIGQEALADATCVSIEKSFFKLF